jgi:hypothetical protein
VPRSYLKLAAVVLASGIAAAACGTVKMGAAAIVGNQRISAATLNGEVANLSAGYQRYQGKIQLGYSQSQLPQQVLTWTVRFRVGEQAAARYGITVTPAQAGKALNDAVAQITQGAKGVPWDEVAVSLGLPPDMRSELGHWVASQNALLTHLNGGKPTTIFETVPAAVASRDNLSVCRAAKSMGIQINPQYGALDYNSLVIVDAPSTLSKAAVSPAPSPSASKPLLTPPC